MPVLMYEVMASEIGAVLEKHGYKMTNIEIKKKYEKFISIEIVAGTE